MIQTKYHVTSSKQDKSNITHFKHLQMFLSPLIDFFPRLVCRCKGLNDSRQMNWNI